MCGRFALAKGDRIDWAQFGVRRGPQLPPHWNLGPGRPIAVVRAGGEGAEVAELKWGLVPSWAKDVTIANKLINARGETAHEKPSFRGAFKARRCLVPADGFFEWQAVPGAKKKQPWFFRRPDDGVFALAGLWERWQPAGGDALETVCLITTDANALMRPIHDRMPVIIAPADYATWLSPTTPSETARGLVRGWDAASMVAHPVSTLVNTPAHDAPECIAPLDGARFG
jgi:putative SOS response-associated peptidase YedK